VRMRMPARVDSCRRWRARGSVLTSRAIVYVRAPLFADTYDNACGLSPATLCTGTWTSYDNSHVAGAGTGETG
jgi:hypothetical protein